MTAIDRRFLELPHVINPSKKNAYDKCLQLLDSWAMLKGARIRGTVDYVHFDAHIEIVSPFFEFFEDRTFDYLRFLMSEARNITFCPTDEGEIEMRACFNYFDDIGDKEKIIEEEISKHADVVDALNEAANIDRKIIMSDPVMSAFITQAANEIGITADEYFDRFEEIMNEADAKPDLYKRHYDTLAKYVEDRRDRLDKRSKRAHDDIDVAKQYLNAISKVPQKDWTMLDTWRVGFQEGRGAVNKEWLEWLEDNFNE
jgi:hypothetical protein